MILFLQVLVFIVLFLCRFGNDGNPKSFGSTDDNFLGTGTVVGYVVVHFPYFLPVLRIRIRRIHMFYGLLDPDPDPLVRGMNPDPSITKQN
jgi:hypothetical protein